MKIAYVTAGTIGAGHLVRGCALGRALHRRGFAGSYKIFAPPTVFQSRWKQEGYESVEIRQEDLIGDRQRAQDSALGRQLLSFSPDLLLVDMFWVLLSQLLPLLKCEAWLLVRCCPPSWLRELLGVRFQPEDYARIIGIEPVTNGTANESVAPIVIANPQDSRPTGALRKHLGVNDGPDLNVVVHAGERGEIHLLREMAGDGVWSELSLFSPNSPFPIAPWLCEATRIVAAAGYNSYWEARWLGYSSRTSFVPLQRPIDDQRRRLWSSAGYQMRENGADVLARWIIG